MQLISNHASRTKHDRHVMTTDVDVRTQATTHHQVRTRHALTPAQVHRGTRARVRTDLRTDSGPHPVHCRSNRCQSTSVDRHWFNSSTVISVSGMSPLTLACGYRRRCLVYNTCWVWSVPRHTSASAIRHTTGGLIGLPTTSNCCRKHGMFHRHASLLDQVLTRPVHATQNY